MQPQPHPVHWLNFVLVFEDVSAQLSTPAAVLATCADGFASVVDFYLSGIINQDKLFLP